MLYTRTIQKAFIIALTAGFVVIASTSFACWNHRAGYGAGAAAYSNTNLTPEQEKQLEKVKQKYSAQLDELQASLNSKTEEYRGARANDSTTIGALKQLETEMHTLEEQYWALLEKANTEAGGLIAGSTGPWFRCNYDGSDHQHRWGMIGQGRLMGPGHMGRIAGHRGGCW